MKISKEQFEKIILEEVYAELEREMIEEGIFDDALEKGKSLFRKKRNDSGQLDRMIKQQHAQEREKDEISFKNRQGRDRAKAGARAKAKAHPLSPLGNHELLQNYNHVVRILSDLIGRVEKRIDKGYQDAGQPRDPSRVHANILSGLEKTRSFFEQIMDPHFFSSAVDFYPEENASKDQRR